MKWKLNITYNPTSDFPCIWYILKKAYVKKCWRSNFTHFKDIHIKLQKNNPTIKHLLPWGKRHVPPLQGHWKYCCEPLRRWQVCQSWLCIPAGAEAHCHNGEPDSSCPSEWHTTDENLQSVGKWCSWLVQWWTFREKQILMKLESYKYGILWKSYICEFIFLCSNTSLGKYVLFSLHKQVGTCTSNPVSIGI